MEADVGEEVETGWPFVGLTLLFSVVFGTLSLFVSSVKLFFCFLLGKHIAKLRQSGFLADLLKGNCEVHDSAIATYYLYIEANERMK